MRARDDRRRPDRGRRAARSRGRTDDLVVVRVHGAGPEPGRPAAARGQLPRAAGLAARHSRAWSSRASSTRSVRERDGVEVGDRVFGIAGGGAQAEYVAVPAGQCAAGARRSRPRRDGRRARGVRDRARRARHARRTSQPGEWVLVHAVGSGVGTAALQLATALGARVVGTARTQIEARPVPRARARARRSCPPLDRRRARRRRARVGGRSKRPTAARTSRSISSAAATSRPTSPRPRSRAASCCVGTIAGSAGDAADPGDHGQAPHDHRHRAPRRATRHEKAAATDGFVRDVVPLLADGRLAPVVDDGHPARPRRRRLRPRRVRRDLRQGHPRLPL